MKSVVSGLFCPLAPCGPFGAHVLQRRSVLGLAGEVVGLVGLHGQFVEFFIRRFYVKEADVLVTLVADGLVPWNPAVAEEVLVEELGAPRSGFACDRRQ